MDAEQASNPRVIDYLDEFVEALKADLLRGEAKWGNTWLRYPAQGQEQRIGDYIGYYFDRFENVGTPVPWEAIAGNAMIAWIREHHPELFPQ